ncbi:GNAT family N-acetyltransferase [Peribacillus alkalitolerans]|uniref:GNAT family N-acetyltransferase n=1 Tax=Peribacillus alkalitolerans TaxID=1550385 RepID=UPI0013D838B6|nr:GNAT family N-acetyltransferase [Peribacillus alkalitolerans]
MENITKQKSVNLVNYEVKYKEELLSFELPDEQAKFTGMPAVMLQDDQLNKTKFPVVIESGGEAVGFFILNIGERVNEYSDNPKALLLSAFSINERHQGKGYAKQGLLQLKDYIKEHFPKCNEVVLGVNHKNIGAQQVYLKTGFVDKGYRKIGRLGEQFILHLQVH